MAAAGGTPLRRPARARARAAAGAGRGGPAAAAAAAGPRAAGGRRGAAAAAAAPGRGGEGAGAAEVSPASLAVAVALLAAGVTVGEPALAAGEAAARNVVWHLPVGADLNQLAAQDPPFWENMVRYSRYFVTLLVGTGYVIVKPLGALLKRPQTAVLLIVGVGGGLFLVKFTLEAMLGLSNDPFGGPVSGGLSAY